MWICSTEAAPQTVEHLLWNKETLKSYNVSCVLLYYRIAADLVEFRISYVTQTQHIKVYHWIVFMCDLLICQAFLFGVYPDILCQQSGRLTCVVKETGFWVNVWHIVKGKVLLLNHSEHVNDHDNKWLCDFSAFSGFINQIRNIKSHVTSWCCVALENLFQFARLTKLWCLKMMMTVIEVSHIKSEFHAFKLNILYWNILINVQQMWLTMHTLVIVLACYNLLIPRTWKPIWQIVNHLKKYQIWDVIG